MEVYRPNKTIPLSSRDTQGVRHEPARQPVVTNEVTISGQDGMSAFSFEQTMPVLPAQEIRIAGGRTIGGGTSTEALRRARRKTQRSK